jgi:hypothetical protein
LVSSFESANNGTFNSSCGVVAVWNNSSSIEESWLNLTESEVFFESAISEVPSNNFDNLVGLVLKFDLVESKVRPVVTLAHVGSIEIVLDIVLMPKVVGWVDPGSDHRIQIKNY